MKKNWWLKLYTYPALKRLIKVSLLIAFFDCFLGWSVLTPLICMYFIFKSLHKGKATFLQNLDFHALHVPYNQLKRDFLSHLGIVFSFGAVTGVTLYSLRAPSPEANESTYMSAALWSLLFVTEAMKPRKQSTLENTGLLKQVAYMTAGFFVLLITMVLVSPFFGPLLSMGTFVAGCVVSSIYVSLKVMFHEVIGPVSYKYRTKYVATGVCFAFISMTGAGLIVSRDIVYSSLQASAKVEVLRQWPGFIHEISSEALIQMGPYLETGEDYVLAYSKTRPAELHEIPVSYHMKNSRSLVAYIRFGNPPHAHFMQIAEIVSNDSRNNEKKLSGVKSFLKEYWPQNTELHPLFQENIRKESVEGVEREIATIEEKQAHVHREPEIEE